MMKSDLSEIHKKQIKPVADDQQRSLAELLDKLSESRKAFSEQFAMTPEKIKEILQSRALEIRSTGAQEDEGELLEILEFTLGEERYAFPLVWVSEVCRVGQITEIPGTPAFVKGIINVRSRIYSVLDLGTLLALPENQGTADDLMIILAAGEMEFAVGIDCLEGVKLLPLKCLQTSLSTLEGVQAEYFKGVTSDHLVLLDAEKLLHDKKIIVE